MARIRTVKPELFRHEGLYEAERETGLPLRIVFIGLFTCCDREGRFQWRPRQLKLDCLPYDDIDFSRVLDALTTRGFVVRYANSGVEYGCIPTFTRHQVINNKERQSEFPCYTEEMSQVVESSCDLTRGRRVDDALLSSLGKDQGEGNKEQGTRNREQGTRSSSRQSLDFSAWPRMPSDQVMADYKKLRASKKAPITQTVVNDMARELTVLDKAGVNVDQALSICCKRGWQGLEADWVLNHLAKNGAKPGKQTQDFASKDYRNGSEGFEHV